MAENIRIKNIYYMLSYAYQALAEDAYMSLATEDFDNIHNLFAAILVGGVSLQVKRGLHRSYLSETEELSSLRGKIDVTDSVRRQTMLAKRMVCTYDVFSEDTQLNQILKATMLLLMRQGDVQIGHRKTLRKLILYFGDVQDVSPRDVRWDAVRFHRNNTSYRMLIGICWLVIKGLLLTTDTGEHQLASFLDDQRMHSLYERFVLGYYKKEHPQLKASASHIEWDVPDEYDKTFLPAMKSDITLSNGEKMLIIDTKYYGKSMQHHSMYDHIALISGNLYQIYTYVKNKDRDATGNVSGMLLYAKTDEAITPDEDYLMGGNRVAAKTLDLDRDWEGIRQQLDMIANEYL